MVVVVCVGWGGVGWGGVEWWWWWSRRDEHDMSLTICHNSPAPNYGSRVPVDTAPGPVPVYRALMVAVILTMCIDATKRQAPNCGGRVPVDTTPGPAPVCRALKTHHRGSSTVSSLTAPVELAGPAHQGHRSPCATGESQWSARPWEAASAPRQGCHRRRGTQRFSQRSGTMGERLSHPQPARENLYDRTTGTSATV